VRNTARDDTECPIGFAPVVYSVVRLQSSGHPKISMGAESGHEVARRCERGNEGADWPLAVAVQRDAAVPLVARVGGRGVAPVTMPSSRPSPRQGSRANTIYILAWTVINIGRFSEERGLTVAARAT